MSKKIGIITSDSLVGSRIYERMISQTDFGDHTDVCIYSRPMNGVDDRVNIYEGIGTLKKMGVDIVVFPEIDFNTIDKKALVNRLPIATSDLVLPISAMPDYQQGRSNIA